MSPEQEQTPGEAPDEAPAVEPTTEQAAKESTGHAAAQEPEAQEPDAQEQAVDTAAEEPAAEQAPAKRRRARAKKSAPTEPVAEESPAEGDSPRRRRGKKAPDTATAEASSTAAPAKPSPARRRTKDAKGRPRRRVVRAQARYVRTSARKARLVSDHLRGRSVQEARAILAYAPREVARDWSKLLDSAVANAENNHELLEDDLIVRDAYADEGPTIKRFRPRAMGRATSIRKRTSHLTITLTPDI
jgi:ribosomal protein L22